MDFTMPGFMRRVDEAKRRHETQGGRRPSSRRFYRAAEQIEPSEEDGETDAEPPACSGGARLVANPTLPRPRSRPVRAELDGETHGPAWRDLAPGSLASLWGHPTPRRDREG